MPVDATKYVYEKAPTHPQDKIGLELNDLAFVLNLQQVWLKEIRPSGTLKNLQLDETQFKQVLLGANVLPSGQDDLVLLQYSIDDQT